LSSFFLGLTAKAGPFRQPEQLGLPQISTNDRDAILERLGKTCRILDSFGLVFAKSEKKGGRQEMPVDFDSCQKKSVKTQHDP